MKIKYLLILLGIVPLIVLAQPTIAQTLFSEQDAINMRLALSDLETKEEQTRTIEANTRTTTAVNFMINIVEPQLTNPRGGYLTQHATILTNFETLQGFMDSATDSETRKELLKRFDLEMDAFNQLRRDHAQGRIS